MVEQKEKYLSIAHSHLEAGYIIVDVIILACTCRCLSLIEPDCIIFMKREKLERQHEK